MDLAKKEALLFKHGSGTGSNISSLRSSREKLSGGGKPSGPLAYWAFWDKVAGIVKSGGKTRRAAKMDILNDNHPDIMEFIKSKMDEEKKLHILIDNGIPWRDAQESVNYQNTNISVRISDAFMQAVETDGDWQTIPIHNQDMVDEMPKYKVKELIRKIAEATHFCGDPGMQYHDTINKWHTCPNSGKIEASNPCSEYMFLDDSACNLASQNLMKFIEIKKDSSKFDVSKFQHSVRLTAIAQDLMIDNSSFPTREIAENTRKFRPLGMGYANLGSMIMSLGLPYDSDEARVVAASITALMTGKVYETSTEMAEKLGTFEEFEKNRDPMLKVMGMHKKALEDIDKSKLPKGLENILDEAEKTWDRVLERGEKYGFRNAQATCEAPTGTIGFMMDCDTKGMEPEIGLVQTKLLSDGGILRLVNSNVKPTLKRLGYDDEQIKDIEIHICGQGNDGNVPQLKEKHFEELKKIISPDSKMKKLKELGYGKKEREDIVIYMDGFETIEGAPHIKEEHLSIFDCSNKPTRGERTISPHGHLNMMAAIQPFLSGGISKTVNLPEEATVEEIEQVYIDAWKMGIKSVALYRDKSKRVQPLNFAKESELEKMAGPVRKKLPITREAITHKFNIIGHEGYVTVGKYENKKAGELFLTMSKEGSTIGGLMGTIGTLTSIALQYGVPLKVLVNKFKHQKFEPRGLVYEGHPDIKTADSLIDYIFNFLGIKFLDGENSEDKNNNKVGQEIKQTLNLNGLDNSGELGGFCAQCGTQMIKKGHCIEKCPSCNWEDAKGCGE
jgi:ribonucleoside-diphosphate reductase alpha chain